MPAPLDWPTYGGGDANPAGLGHVLADGDALPRLVPQETGPNAACHTPVSFAPIPRDWPQRAQWAGRYDAEWSRRRAPLLPADLDPRYWQASSPDQWVEPETLPGAELQLSGFGPQPPSITLQDCELEIATRFRGRWHQLTPRLQAVTVDLDTQRLSLLWLAVLPIEADKMTCWSSAALSRCKTAAASACPALTCQPLCLHGSPPDGSYRYRQRPDHFR